MTRAKAQPMEFSACGPLRGALSVPGDKSISHRALMLAALANGRSRIEGLSEGDDVLATAAALRAMGARIEQGSDGTWEVDGVGADSLSKPKEPLDMGNSGTSARLLMGLAATRDIEASFRGDASLSRRPMDRVAEPLRLLGAKIDSAPGDRLPLTVRGGQGEARQFRLPVASAQVKSALLLAGLNIAGETRIVEPAPTRDHSERMLKLFGAHVEVSDQPDGTRLIALRGPGELRPQHIHVPGDPSSAAFLAVAALIVPGSEVLIRGVCVNPMRMGLYRLLETMGADISFSNEREVSGEPVADIRVRHSPLKAADVPVELVPSMIDEFPIFFVAAAMAEGTSRAHGLSELRVKESDRITAMAVGLRAIGVEVSESGDGLTILGSGGARFGSGAEITSQLDHRIAMSFAVAGLASEQPVTVDDMNPVSTSFPGFAAALQGLAS